MPTTPGRVPLTLPEGYTIAPLRGLPRIISDIEQATLTPEEWLTVARLVQAKLESSSAEECRR
jgi:hypothetical protein